LMYSAIGADIEEGKDDWEICFAPSCCGKGINVNDDEPSLIEEA